MIHEYCDGTCSEKFPPGFYTKAAGSECHNGTFGLCILSSGQSVQRFNNPLTVCRSKSISQERILLGSSSVSPRCRCLQLLSLCRAFHINQPHVHFMDCVISSAFKSVCARDGISGTRRLMLALQE